MRADTKEDDNGDHNMLIKVADDKSERLALLQSLAERSDVPKAVRDWAAEERFRLQRGMEGERDAAFYLDSAFRDSTNRMVIHDLRLVVDGEVAQIDHLILTREPAVFLLETKCFNGALRINANGEFSVRYGSGREYGIESPIEQSRRHERILLKVMRELGIQGRSGNEPAVNHAVLIHPKATVQRPAGKDFDTDMVMKADQFPTWFDRFQERRLGVGQTLALGLFSLRSAETAREFAEKLVRQHRRPDMLGLPPHVQAWLDSAKKAAAPAAPDPEAKRAAPQGLTTDPAAQKRPTLELAQEGADGQKRLICAECGQKISFAEGKFCWNNAQRFGGLQYCRPHQAAR